MLPEDNSLEKLLESMWDAEDSDSRAYAENYLFEERVSLERQTDYEKALDSSLSSFDDWDRWHRDKYIWNRIHQSVPETFKSMNQSAAHSGDLSPDQYLIRVENLEYAISSIGLSLDELHGALMVAYGEETNSKYSSDEAEELLALLCDNLNHNPYRVRPRFAGFLHDVEGSLTDYDWPDKVRDLFGLAHYTPQVPGETIPIILLRYTVREIMEMAKEDDDVVYPICVPTTLDSQFSVYFFPSPRELPYGRTLNLAVEDISEDKIAEIMHFRITYRTEHIYKIGAITRGLDALETVGLSKMRSNHLFSLKYDSNRDDFGTPPAHWKNL